MSAFSFKNGQDAITLIDEKIMNLNNTKISDLTPRRPRRRETIIQRRQFIKDINFAPKMHYI